MFVLFPKERKLRWARSTAGGRRGNTGAGRGKWRCRRGGCTSAAADTGKGENFRLAASLERCFSPDDRTQHPTVMTLASP
jgi:hypothetical protein